MSWMLPPRLTGISRLEGFSDAVFALALRRLVASLEARLRAPAAAGPAAHA